MPGIKSGIYISLFQLYRRQLTPNFNWLYKYLFQTFYRAQEFESQYFINSCYISVGVFHIISLTNKRKIQLLNNYIINMLHKKPCVYLINNKKNINPKSFLIICTSLTVISDTSIVFVWCVEL